MTFETLSYTALNLHTANRSSKSLCGIGILVVENDKIVYTKYIHIKPRTTSFSYEKYGYFKKEQLTNAPNLEEVWSEIDKFIKGKNIVLYNAPQSLKILEDSLGVYKIALPKCQIVDISEIVFGEDSTASYEELAAKIGYDNDFIKGDVYENLKLYSACVEYAVEHRNIILRRNFGIKQKNPAYGKNYTNTQSNKQRPITDEERRGCLRQLMYLGGFVFLTIILAFVGWLREPSNITSLESKSSKTSMPAEISYTEVPAPNYDELMSTQNTASQEATPNNNNYKGRGQADSGRSEPQYVGVRGYAVVGYGQDTELTKAGAFFNTPWLVPTYVPDKQFWNQTDTFLEHKTIVAVKEQKLAHRGYGNYDGYLLVVRESDNAEFYIDVGNFITKPYWTYSNADKSSSVGKCIAVYHQVSNFYPVSRDGKKREIDNGQQVLILNHTDFGADNNRENKVHALVWKDGDEYGFDAYFNYADLKVIY